MYRIALNVAISHVRGAVVRRKHAADALTNDSGDPGQDFAISDERVALLQRFIHGLDPLNRALLLLYMEERSQAEIADVLGISTTNVSTKINRLKQRIRAEVANASA